jgi:hypothetical protein
LHGLKARMLATADQQISLTDPDSRSMATSGRGSGVVGYNVQVAVDTEHHLIITHEVSNVGSDRAQLTSITSMAWRISATLLFRMAMTASATRCFTGRGERRIEVKEAERDLPKPRARVHHEHCVEESRHIPACCERSRATPRETCR